ncbi:hypothetical protein C0993_003154 [Termitomyces sp. T159_Od127]|nr:hypothetical protein C0993_003154 [Termitomyces sp. T159_Od127]
MAPVLTNALPIIDITPFLNPDTADADAANLRTSTAAALHTACIEYGFFYLDVSAYVDAAEPARLAELDRQFFRLPQAEKDRLALKDEHGVQSYARLKENVTNGRADNHEGIDFYRPVEKPDRMRMLLGKNLWPEIEGFQEVY